MKNIKFRYLTLFFVVCGFVSCSDENLMFNADAALYFKVSQADENLDKKLIVTADTVVFSFAYEVPEIKEYKIKIPMEIVGLPVDRDRRYKIVVEAGKTTGEMGKHFKVLDDYYVMPKGVGVDTLEIVALRNPELRATSKDLTIKLVATEDFRLGRKEDLSITVRVSDKLEVPDWWKPGTAWETYIFGPYHYIKHQEWIKIAKRDGIYGKKTGLPGDLPKNTQVYELPWGAPVELMSIKSLKLYFQNNPRYTLEDYPDAPNYPGDRITIPSPF